MRVLILTVITILSFAVAQAQSILPPVQKWSGASEKLMAKKKNPWITPSELSDLTTTPDYAETMEWFKKLCAASPLFTMKTIGISEQNREIVMIIASKDQDISPEALQKSSKSLVLAQGGIHAGEIDGKDAGMMLLRDIAFGGKDALLDQVNFLFIPILNVDGHERTSPYNRVNQRGPENMGWRTNAKNLNLNRDYTKMETAGVQAVIGTINAYDPDLYIDLHVTDGADYQFDVTYGWSSTYAPAINEWMQTRFRTAMDKSLISMGHQPGPLMFAFNNRDFSEGNSEFEFSPRFSDTYGTIRKTPSILVENHSLKPYKQRVLGTYVFLEETLKIMADNKSLNKAIAEDRALRPKSIDLEFGLSESLKDSMLLKGITSEMKPSQITGGNYVSWTGKTYEQKVVVRKMNKVLRSVSSPAAYWIPAEWSDITEKLKAHGVEMEIITEPRTVAVEQYTVAQYEFAKRPFEGHIRCEKLDLTPETKTITYLPGSARISMDQYKGVLAAFMLEPYSPDSFLQWGYMHSIFIRTEYIEQYIIEPLAEHMLAADSDLKKRFEEKKATDEKFASNPFQIYQWFYEQSPYYDQTYRKYPITREL